MKILIIGANDAKRNDINFDDINEIIKRVIEKQVFGIFECTYPVDVTISKIAETAQKVFNKGGKIIFDETKPNIADNIFYFNDDLYKKIDYFPTIDLTTGIEAIK